MNTLNTTKAKIRRKTILRYAWLIIAVYWLSDTKGVHSADDWHNNRFGVIVVEGRGWWSQKGSKKIYKAAVLKVESIKMQVYANIDAGNKEAFNKSQQGL